MESVAASLPPSANLDGVVVYRPAIGRAAVDASRSGALTAFASPFRLHASRQNRLLEVLPRAAWEALGAQLELVDLRPGKVLFDAGTPRADLYFPTSAIISLLHVMRDGASAEIAVVGCEGMVDVAALMGGAGSAHRCVVHSGGGAFRLRAAVLEAAFSRAGPVMHLMLRYAQSLLAQIAQTAVCNRHHALEQQLCRWLLQRLDRLPNETLLLTHESIAGMLGVRREGVTEAAGRLQKAGVIRCRRGRITRARPPAARSPGLRVLRGVEVRDRAPAARPDRLVNGSGAKIRSGKMEHAMYPQPSRELQQKRQQLAPAIDAAFKAFSDAVFADGALPAKTKELIAVAVAHVTQCPYCIRGHTQRALRRGATEQELMEAIWVAAEMRAGGAYAHSNLALETMNQAARPGPSAQ